MNFLDYVSANSVRVPWSGCTVWMRATTAGGYGRSRLAEAAHRTTIVHRAVYEHLHGPVPQGMYVCHECDNPECVNPDHLFLGTPSDNAQDRQRKGRSAPKNNEFNGRAKISNQAVASIKAMRAEGALQEQIAKAHGISQSQVSRILRGLNRRLS